MKCKEAHLLIAGLTGDDIPNDLAEHAAICAECAERLHADRILRTHLRAEMAPPAYALGRIREGMADYDTAQQGSWRKSRSKSVSIMKKITLSAFAAAAVAAAFIGIPNHAEAARPLATFAKMKSAVLATAKNQQGMDLNIKVGKKDDGSIGTWLVVNGQLIELGPNDSYQSSDGSVSVQVRTSTDGNAADLSKLPPDVQKQVEKAIQDAMSGKSDPNVTFTGSINGQPADYDQVQALLKQLGFNFTFDIDLDSDHYKAVAFGKDEHTLILTPKSKLNSRMVVSLDPKTSLPKNVVLQKLVNGTWKEVRHSTVTLA